MSAKIASPQPFIYGRPVRPGEFLNREAELRTIFNRLRNGESTAVVGEPHLAKVHRNAALDEPVCGVRGNGRHSSVV